MTAVVRWAGDTFADRLAVTILVILTAMVVITFRQYGATFDEAVQDDYGRYILDWYLSLGADRNAVTYIDLFYYGGLFDTIAALLNKISPFGHYETRHLLNGLVGLVGLIGCWQLGRRLGGAVVGLLSLVALALMPSWYGMMFINPKDIPFAAAMVWGTALLTIFAESPEHPSNRTVITLGVVTGLALGIRIGALLLLVYLGSLLIVAALRRWPEGWRTALSALIRMTIRTYLPVLGIAWAIMLVFWPYAQLDPIANPIRAFFHFSERLANIPTLYFGTNVSADYHPRLYLPVYIVLKLPDVVVCVLGTAAVIGIWRCLQGDWRTLSLRFLPLLLSIAVPLGYVIATDAELYDAERHFLFLLPPLAVLAAFGIREIFRWLETPALRAAVAAGLAFGGVVQLTDMVRLHPYEYAFFNDLVGGVAGAAGRFETEYWGEALTEVARDLAARISPTAAPGSVPVMICGEEDSLAEHLPRSVRIVDSGNEARYYLSTTRNHCDADVPGSEIARVGRDGVPFAVLKEVMPAMARASGSPPRS